MDSLVVLSSVVVALIVLGTVACLPLYKGDLRALVRSPLFTKIAMWLPIYLIFLGVILGGPVAGVALVTVIGLTAVTEYRRALKKHGSLPWQVAGYGTLFLICLVGMTGVFLGLPPEQYITVVTLLCFGSVISDVCAFFLGSYTRGHKLPDWINSRKSWEGVAGQFIGGVVGVLIVAAIMSITPVWWLGVLIGAASAVGDLANSIAKRQLGIKDWGNSIPGHGGVLDRCSSLSMAFLPFACIIQFSTIMLYTA